MPPLTSAVEFQDRCLKPLGHPSKFLILLGFLEPISIQKGHCYRICYRTPFLI